MIKGCLVWINIVFSLQSHSFESAIKPSDSEDDRDIKPTEKWNLEGLKLGFSKRCASTPHLHFSAQRACEGSGKFIMKEFISAEIGLLLIFIQNNDHSTVNWTTWSLHYSKIINESLAVKVSVICFFRLTFKIFN